jgi:palmitoyl-protein thioesterase
MWDQVELFGAVARQISKENPEGIHLLCYSQGKWKLWSEFLIKIIILYSEGGLVCRGMIENFSDLNVLTFVSLSSPQGGQYGGIFHIILGFYLVIVICLFLNRFFSATDF